MSKKLLIARKLVIENLKEILLQAKIEKIVDNKNEKWVYLETKNIKLNNENCNIVFDTINFKNSDILHLYNFKVFTTKKASAIPSEPGLNTTDTGIITSNKNPVVKKYVCDFKLNSTDTIFDTNKNFKSQKNRITNTLSQNLIRRLSSGCVDNNDIYKLRAVGTTINFEGFYILYNFDNDNNDEKKLPKLKEGQDLTLINIKTEQHFTEPPARYSEASLVKKMEELGIGRPSTYATILSVIQEREYVKLQQKRFFPEERGRIVTAFLKEYFKKYVEYNYTAELENELDRIADGQEDRVNFLNSFWRPFKKEIDQTLEIKPSDVVNNLSSQILPHLLGYDENGALKDNCPNCNGKLTLKFGKFGAFISCSNYPECRYIQNVGQLQVGDETNTDRFEPKLLGTFKDKNVYLKKGPYGFYIQLGENSTQTKTTKLKKEEGNKPKLIGIPKTEKEPQNFTMEQALQLLTLPDLPRNIGKYNNKDVLANKGRFGPYILYDGSFYSVKNDDIYTIELERAMEIIKEKDAKQPSKLPKKKK
ncbi:MAG: topoisomerase DNA-binding C4 zinc finger domain-containing protein [Rickettsiales bacterium]|nr:topoisomerase DNA-binding C4 zinc finger domain-containing protein [Rickettsiales bacterium]